MIFTKILANLRRNFNFFVSTLFFMQHNIFFGTMFSKEQAPVQFRNKVKRLAS
jgi:hypothetical protein